MPQLLVLGLDPSTTHFPGFSNLFWDFFFRPVCNLSDSDFPVHPFHMANLLMKNELSVAQMLPSKGCA